VDKLSLPAMLCVGGDLLSSLLFILLRGIRIHFLLYELPYYDRSGDMARYTREFIVMWSVLPPIKLSSVEENDYVEYVAVPLLSAEEFFS